MTKLIRIDCTQEFADKCDRTRKELGLKTVSEFVRLAIIGYSGSHGIKWGELDGSK